jgi:hypothetical protein
VLREKPWPKALKVGGGGFSLRGSVIITCRRREFLNVENQSGGRNSQIGADIIW